MSDFVKIQEAPFSMEEVHEEVKKASTGIGALVHFIGTARDLSHGVDIKGLDFEHYPGMAEKKLSDIRKRALENFNIMEMAIVHRVGHIDIGEDIVIIVAASAHRNDAFMACEWAITEVKRVTPIWKSETTSDGDIWVSDTP